jgi:hypothetical protein
MTNANHSTASHASPLQDLIESHRIAFAALDATCRALDEIEDNDAQADDVYWLQREREALNAAATKAAMAILKYRPTTIGEARAKMHYIAEADTIRTSIACEDVLDLLLKSFLAPTTT